MRYTKPALSFTEQVARLESRKLVIEDRARAEEALSHISYYRLSAYFRPFRQPNSEDFAGASFDDVLALYKFDKDLRSLVSDALEVIEVHIRTKITYHLALRGDAFAHIDPANFITYFNHRDFLIQVKECENKSSDRFVSHFRTKYAEEAYLPIWMATEVMSFGFISKMYESLLAEVQKEVAVEFGVHQSVLRTWLHTLSYVRNICAHHGRLWNRQIAIAPAFPNNRIRWSYLGLDPQRCYSILVLIQDILSRIGNSERCKDAFVHTLLSANQMQLDGMRVPIRWTTFSPWFVGPQNARP
jgi:abortive infection bacteriophage resistance protein